MALVLLDLEHDSMTPEQDWRYQASCAWLADVLAIDDELWARLARAALTCHHCEAP